MNIMKSLKYFLFAFLGLGIIVACDNDFSDPQGDEMAKFNAWIQVHNIPAEAQKTSGLYYISTREGSGSSPVDGDYVIYSYKEKTLEGIVLSTNDYATAKLYSGFDANYHYSPVFTAYDSKLMTSGFNPLEGYTISINLSTGKGVTRYMNYGLYEGLGYMKEGGKATLIVPSKLAYKGGVYALSSAASTIPYQSMLYEVELHKVVKNPRDYEKEVIKSYIDSNYPGLETINDSIYYIQLSPPTHDSIVGKDSIVMVYYKGMFLDGFVFDTNIDSVQQKLYGRTFSGKAAREVTIGKDVVKGFSQALTKMNYGEWARVIVPSYCGYDSTGNEKIPPFTPLIFDIYYQSKVKVK